MGICETKVQSIPGQHMILAKMTSLNTTEIDVTIWLLLLYGSQCTICM